jgi:alkylation response protein AidB-like acyl-CoA dehydrogenase
VNFASIELDERTTAFLHELRAFLDEHLTEQAHEEERNQGNGISLTLHRALGGRGWIVPTWSRAEGGAELDPLEAWLLSVELSAREAPYQVVGSNRLVLNVIKAWGTEELKQEVLPRATSGEAIMTLGYTEPGTGSDIAAVSTRATRDGDSWVVSGQKIFTTGAHVADYSMVLARSDLDAPKHRGLTMVLVPLKADGVQIQAIHTLAGERTNIVFYDDVRVPDSHRLGPENEGWKVASEALGEEHDVGGGAGIWVTEGPFVAHLHRLHDAVVDWSRQPHEGVVPLDDQTVRTRLAEVTLALEVATVSTGSAGRVVSSELLIASARRVLDLVGPTALLDRGAPGAATDGLIAQAHLFAQGTAIYGGTTEIHRNIIAERSLKLPRSTPRS